VHASRFVHFVDVPLVYVNNENHIIAETAESVHGWHGNDETEEVVDDCVEKFVEKRVFGHVLDRL